MVRKSLFVMAILLLISVLVGAGMSRVGAQATDNTNTPCPPDFVAAEVLDPIHPGEQASKVVERSCRPANEEFETVVLDPLRPGDEGWNVEPAPIDQGDDVNGTVTGPSNERVYRCVVLLEPIRPGEQFSRASEPVCSDGPINMVNGISLDSSYLIAKFYDRTNYGTLLVEYYGPSACSPTISYGVLDLPDNLDNRLASGQAYSSCDHIYVYDFNNYGGPSYSCGASCSSFYALNDEVSSWRVTD